ncbi:MAG: DUF2029 domain-containing protein [Tetrasphaera sp.]|jgi:alpha-1,2-mannosyltransferase|nr:DUF2029 domain-containing protein [Tetrasphaera sp.]
MMSLKTPAFTARSSQIIVLIAAIVAGLIGLRYKSWLSEPSRFQDLAVYRRGAEAILSGDELYQSRTHGQGELVFTYPPFAAIAFTVFALLPWVASISLLLVLSACAYALFVYLFGRELNWPTGQILLAGYFGLLSEPILRTVQQGQINVVLAALVVVDLLLLPRRFRGVLIGLAAGIKLVPAAFVICLVAQRDWRSIIRVAVTGLATIAVSYLVNPASTRQYWLKLLFSTERSGGGGYPDNQSLVGVIARILHDDTPNPLATLPLQAAALGAAYYVVRRAHERNDRATLVVAGAMGSLLASPVSWSHHWIWCIPFIMQLCASRQYIFSLIAAAVFAVSPLTLSPLGVLDQVPRPWWVLATAAMPLTGAAWLIMQGFGARPIRVGSVNTIHAPGR